MAIGPAAATSIWNTTTLLGYIGNLGTYSNGILPEFIIISVFFICFFVLKNFTTASAILVSTTITALVTVLLWAAGIATYTQVKFMVAVLLIVIIINYFID